MPNFHMGSIVATPAALEAMRDDDPMAYLRRHARGDWGVVCDADKRLNDQAVKHGTRLLSAYVLRDGVTRIWIIAEADRSATTILLPGDY